MSTIDCQYQVRVDEGRTVTISGDHADLDKIISILTNHQQKGANTPPLLMEVAMRLHFALSEVTVRHSRDWSNEERTAANAALDAAYIVLSDSTGSTQWLPIKTAPQDGTLVLLWSNGYYAGRWSQERGNWLNPDGFLLLPSLWAPLPRMSAADALTTT